MKLALIAALALLGSPAFAQDVLGTWKTQPSDTGEYAHVEMAVCEGKVCGTLVGAFNAKNESSTEYEHLGKRMVWDMVSNGGGKFSSGKIWAPDRDKTYSSKMELDGDTLKVSGCVAAVLCRSQDWTRVQ